jgi:hypothetical protein
MWETIRTIINLYGLAGALLIGVAFFVYILYKDKNMQSVKDAAREERLNQMTDRIIEITGQVGKVVGSNTEVFREVSQRLVELKDTNISEHKNIIDKVEKLDDGMGIDHKRLEDKISNLK